MNVLSKILLVGFSMLFLLGSCTTEKKLQRPDTHAEWISAKQKGHNGNYKNCSLCMALYKENSEQHDHTTARTIEQVLPDPTIVEASNTSRDELLDLDASSDVTQLLLPRATERNWHLKEFIAATEMKESLREFGSQSEKETKLPHANSVEKSGYSVMALLGFTFGILGLALVFATGWPFLFGPLAVIFSAIGMGQISRGKKGLGFAIAGIYIGFLAIIISLSWLVLLTLFSF